MHPRRGGTSGGKGGGKGYDWRKHLREDDPRKQQWRADHGVELRAEDRAAAVDGARARRHARAADELLAVGAVDGDGGVTARALAPDELAQLERRRAQQRRREQTGDARPEVLSRA